MAQQVRVGGQPDAGRQGGRRRGWRGWSDRRAPLGAAHQVQLDRVGWPAGFHPTQRHGGGLAQGQAQSGLLAAVLRSAWTAKGGRVRMALLALDLTGPRASPRRRPVELGSALSGRMAGSMMGRA
jgi:hypothetical protein